MADILAHIWMESVASLPTGKVEATVVQWLGDAGIEAVREETDALAKMTEATAFAVDVQLYLPSLMGSTAVERFARKYRPADHAVAAALEAFRKGRFRLLDLDRRTNPELIEARDPFTGETLSILNTEASQNAFGRRAAARVCLLPGGWATVLGPLIPLDASALDVVSNFIRPGRGLVNPERCAAALYKHIVRHGVERIDGLNALPESPEEDFLSDNDDDGLSLFANNWADREQGAEPSAESIAEARGYTSIPGVIECLFRAVAARRAKKFRLIDAYTQIASLQIETLYLRGRAGVGGDPTPLGGVAAAIDRAIADGLLPTDVHALFEDLSTRVRAQNGARTATAGAAGDLDRVLQRIRGLRAKTIDKGCTEQEALAAADKVAELLDRYGLSLSELEIKEQSCESVGIDTERRRKAAFDECIPAIADFCDCRVWGETTATRSIRYIFFGLPADVEAAHYLYDLIEVTFETETASFKLTDLYTNARTGARRSVVSSFQTGLANGLRVKLTRLKRERSAASRASSGRDLVPLKASVIEEDLERLGLSFRTKRAQRSKMIRVDAFEAGQAAGQKFEPHRGLGSQED